MRALLCLSSMLCACSGTELHFENAHLDLGAVIPGVERLEPVHLISQSESSLKIQGTDSNNERFSLKHSFNTLLAPNDVTTLTVSHTPPLGATGPQQARLRAWTEAGEAAFEVTSEPVVPNCELPDLLDFGPVKLGETVTLEIPVRNDTALDSAAEVFAVTTFQDIFAVQAGRRPLAAGHETTVAVTFHPTFNAEFGSVVMIRGHLLCEAHRVTLLGTGVSAFVTPAQNALSWMTSIGTSEAKQMTLQNRSLTPVSLFDVRATEGVNPSQVFHVLRFPVRIAAAERAPDGRLIPGEASVEINFTPMALQDYFGELELSTDLAAQPLVEVTLIGAGR